MSRAISSAVVSAAAAALAVAGSACVMPRSMGFGQLATALPAGVTEVGATVGLQYASQSQPPVRFDPGGGADVTTTQESRSALAFPAAEANVRVGLSKLLGLNVHLSGQGLQPGLKLTLVETKALALALLPALAVGVGTSGGNTQKTIGNKAPLQDARSGSTHFLFGAGLKAVFSHSSGFYGGLGYDFVLLSTSASSASTTAGGAVESLTGTTTTAHQLLLGAGMSFSVGGLHIRPELAVSFVPGLSVDTRASTVPATAEVTTSAAGGSGFAFFPSVTFAAAAEPPKPPRDEEGGEEDGEGEGDGEGERDAPKGGRGAGPGAGDADDEGSEAPRPGKRGGRPAPRQEPPQQPDEDTESEAGDGREAESAPPSVPRATEESDEEPAPTPKKPKRPRGDGG